MGYEEEYTAEAGADAFSSAEQAGGWQDGTDGSGQALGEVTNRLAATHLATAACDISPQRHAAAAGVGGQGQGLLPRATTMKAMAPMTAAKAHMRADTPSSMASPEAMSPSMRWVLLLPGFAGSLLLMRLLLTVASGLQLVFLCASSGSRARRSHACLPACPALPCSPTCLQGAAGQVCVLQRRRHPAPPPLHSTHHRQQRRHPAGRRRRPRHTLCARLPLPRLPAGGNGTGGADGAC